MLNNLKNAIRKKKLYFTAKSSAKNTDLLHSLLANKVIVGFTKYSQKTKTSLIVFVNYGHNFNSSITKMSFNSNRVSKQQNNVLGVDFFGSNFVLNMGTNKKSSSSLRHQKSQKPRYLVKFR